MTQAVAVHWWRAEDGFAPALPTLPALATRPGDASFAAGRRGLDAARALVIGVRGRHGERTAARLAIRQALAAALAELTRLPSSRIALCTTPGQAPHALLDLEGDGERRVSLSISHDGVLSLAALRMADAAGPAAPGAGSGGIGIDLMRIAAIPDWHAVAHDYLGPEAARCLAALSDAQRPTALARAWSEREARLKCLGLPLAEWDGAGAQRIDTAGICLPLDLPAPYCGALALG